MGSYSQYENINNRDTGQGSQSRRFPNWAKNLIIVVVSIIVLLFFIVLLFSGDSNNSDYTSISDNIAILHVEGTISSDSDAYTASSYNHNWILNTIDEMIADPSNKGMVLFINSPGGGIYESDELYLRLKEYQDMGKPIYAAMGSMAASGGYYIAAPADKIYANRNTITGSIGVTFGTFFDFSGFLERYGINTTTITSGDNKAMGSMSEPMTTEQIAIYQSIIDEAYDQFVGIVSEERGIALEKAKTISDGRVYTAKQAKSLALVDEVGTVSDALNDLIDEYGFWNCDIQDVYYTTNITFMDLLLGSSSGSLPSGEFDAILKILNEEQKLPFGYYCKF